MTVSKKILIITEEEEENKILTEKFLQLDNYDIITCNNGHDALGIIEENHEEIGFVLLDDMISGMTANEILTQIKLEYPKIRIVLISYKNFFENIQKGKELGANGYIVKNISGKNDGDDDFSVGGFPFFFSPPEPPDDFGMAPQVQVHRSPQKK